ncbi:condensation domain-containing protein [Streptomyces sp. NPDC058330]|uniref:condensation domain-containing protein n=1 Tax=Streptomyces sp. NPDC058330 TaxID=3346449 RepID=UPI0036EEE7EE
MTTLPSDLPLAAGQERIWRGQMKDPASPVHNLGLYVDIRGDLDAKLLERAGRQVLEEAETLRVTVVEDEKGLRQRIEPVGDWTMPHIDLSEEPDPQDAARRWMDEEMARPRAWGRPPQFSCALLTLGPGRHWWFGSTHHLVNDGFGSAVVVRRLSDVYTALTRGDDTSGAALPPLRVLLDEEAQYRSSEQHRRDQAYWRAKFADRPTPLSLSARTDPPAAERRRSSAALDPAVGSALKKVADQAGTSWPRALVAAVAGYVHGVTGEKDVILGFPVSARPTFLTQVIPGLRSNLVPLRLRVEPSTTVRELVGHVRQEMRAALTHQRYRHEELREDLGILHNGKRLNGPVVNIMPFDYDLWFGPAHGVMRNLSTGPVSDIDIVCYGSRPEEQDGVRLDLEANPARYSAAEFERHGDSFRAFLTALSRSLWDDPAADIRVAEALELGRAA